MESRIHGDMYVRFGGRYGETYCRKAERHSVPSLQTNLAEVQPERIQKLMDRLQVDLGIRKVCTPMPHSTVW